MYRYADDANLLWERYLETRSTECQRALLQHYAPAVLMQACCWSRGPLSTPGEPAADLPGTDRMTLPPEGQPFIPYVPPTPGPKRQGSGEGPGPRA
ncbi:MAG: hypothetical protein KA354_13880 [Phycisphaerae bacterium]|nr:hypothetical protein [Phycisphaerae bacterium]